MPLKNSELIQKLLELPKVLEQKFETVTTYIVDGTAAIEVSIDVAPTIDDIAAVEEVATVEVVESELKPEIDDEQADGSNEAITKEMPEPQEHLSFLSVLTEDKPLVVSMEQCAFSLQTRRLSARLSAAHVKRYVDSPRPNPSLLNRKHNF